MNFVQKKFSLEVAPYFKEKQVAEKQGPITRNNYYYEGRNMVSHLMKMKQLISWHIIYGFIVFRCTKSSVISKLGSAITRGDNYYYTSIPSK